MWMESVWKIKKFAEIDRIFDELADGVPELTLLRLSEEDVALDMDEVVDVIDEEEGESSDDESEESSKSGADWAKLQCGVAVLGLNSAKFH